jgi:hypothetical protein
MFQQLSGATRLYPIIGDPVKSARLTSNFENRGHNGLCIPMQVSEGDLDLDGQLTAAGDQVRGDPRYHPVEVLQPGGQFVQDR